MGGATKGRAKKRLFLVDNVFLLLPSSHLRPDLLCPPRKITSLVSEDVINALNYLGLLKYISNNYALIVPTEVIEELIKRHPIKEPRVDAEKLHWAPLVGQYMGKDKWSIKAKRPDAED